MPLSRHIEQGRLLYFTRNPDAISVCENKHFRWLAFDSVIQSVMNIRLPNQLTLPHHYGLLLPLRYYNPTNVIEFGLGGGNISRFINANLIHIKHKVIEQNKDVIYCFKRYFLKNKNNIELINQNAEAWLVQQNTTTTIKNTERKEWFIYDIYQHQDEQLPANNHALYQLVEALTDDQLLSINLPFIEKNELKQIINKLGTKSDTHYLKVYRVPQYRNKIIHLIPRSYACTVKSTDTLSSRFNKYLMKYEQHFSL